MASTRILGLRTQLSFSMFSNLRTEGGISNHLFMPRLLSLGIYPEDRVEILTTDDAELARPLFWARGAFAVFSPRGQGPAHAVPSLNRDGAAPSLPKRSGKRRAHIPIEKPVKL